MLVLILLVLLFTCNGVFNIKHVIENNNSKKVSKEIFFEMLGELNINLVLEKEMGTIKYSFMYNGWKFYMQSHREHEMPEGVYIVKED